MSEVHKRFYEVLLLFDRWFTLKKLYTAIINVVEDMVVMGKTNIKGLYKDIIEKLTKHCPGLSCLVLKRKCTVPRERLIIDIGYRYNEQKVISLISA